MMTGKWFRRTRSCCVFGSIAVVVQLCLVWYMVRTIAWCSPIVDRLITMPDGRQMLLYNPALVEPPFSSLVDKCEYGANGRLDCPNVKHKGNTVLRQLQLSTTRMLRLVDLMSRKHGFDYWLFKGSLVGAVRQKRLNAWDEDIDICFMRKDYEIFIRHAASELPKDVFLQTRTSDPEYGKVRRLFNDAKLRDTTTCYGYCLRKGCKFHDGYEVDVMVFDYTDPTGGVIEDEFHKFRFQKEEIFPLRQQEFEGFPVSIPRKAEALLSAYYGDCCDEPPFADQCTTFVGSSWSSCEQIANMNASYKQHLIVDTIMTKYPRVSQYFV